MKLVQHIKVAEIIANKLDNELKDGFKVNRVLFYLGSIAPDLNCVYPAHRLSTTSKRFQNRVKRVDKYENSAIKSFTLGIITHYVCDYFCYAHNIESLGIPHKNYETGLYKYFLSHKQLFTDSDGLLKEWEEAKKVMQEKCMAINGSMDIDLHAEMIIEQIRILNNNYMNSSLKKEDRVKEAWTKNKYQWNHDLDYAIFMCTSVLKLVVEPVRCVSSVMS